MSTHYGLRVNGKADNGKQTQANSLAPCVKHFFDMSVTTTDANGNTTIQDVVTSAVIEANVTPASYSVTTAGATANSVRIQMSEQGQQNFTFAALPSTGDFLVMVCGKALTEGGMVSFDMGPGGGLTCRGQRAVVGLATNDAEKSPRYCHTASRRSGVTYVFCSMVRGNTLQHYVYDDIIDATILAGQRDLSAYSHIADARAHISGGARSLSIGHGNYLTDINAANDSTCGSAVGADGANDYFGVMVCHFTNGSPTQSEIIQAMEFAREQWPTGNKASPPTLVSY